MRILRLVSHGAVVDAGVSDGPRCLWCGVAIGLGRRWCSKRCRQTAWRARRLAVTEDLCDTPKRLAYADPPFPGDGDRWAVLGGVLSFHPGGDSSSRYREDASREYFCDVVRRRTRRPVMRETYGAPSNVRVRVEGYAGRGGASDPGSGVVDRGERDADAARPRVVEDASAAVALSAGPVGLCRPES